MKKIIFLIIINLVCLFGVSSVALAQNSIWDAGLFKGPISAVGLEPDAEASTANIISLILSMVGVIFLVLTVVAGVMWMTASGDDHKIDTAKKIIVGATAGLAIVMFAYTITYFVNSSIIKAGGSGNNSGGSNDIGCCIYNNNGYAESMEVTEAECNRKPQVQNWDKGPCKWYQQ